MPHPYTTTIHGLDALINRLRHEFPDRVTPETLRTWSIGRSNESSLLATLRFVGVVDEDRHTLPQAREVFRASSDEVFTKAFATMVKEAYSELFEKHGDRAWTLSRDSLISFMREADHSSARVGDLQAVTFQALARHAGEGVVQIRTPSAAGRRQAVRSGGNGVERRSRGSGRGMADDGDGVRIVHAGSDPSNGARDSGHASSFVINIHLPVTEDPDVYDSIFRSLLNHLLNSDISRVQ